MPPLLLGAYFVGAWKSPFSVDMRGFPHEMCISSPKRSLSPKTVRNAWMSEEKIYGLYLNWGNCGYSSCGYLSRYSCSNILYLYLQGLSIQSTDKRKKLFKWSILCIYQWRKLYTTCRLYFKLKPSLLHMHRLWVCRLSDLHAHGGRVCKLWLTIHYWFILSNTLVIS